jgi:transcriptional regulator with XRE-family HTH domain/anti-sigma regulatory factor (Ser/Thr protein kinase)
MSEAAKVVSLADRLKQRREELGLSQAQAARELDVARTAYRLWEMEAAKPQPDRWRLISRWLGVSVTTMLLADELEMERSSTVVSDAFERVGRDWNETMTLPAEYFARAQILIQEGVEKGFVGTQSAEDLLSMFRSIQNDQSREPSALWEPAKLYRELAAGTSTPRTAREALDFVAGDLPRGSLETARLLVTELVTNSVRHGPQGNATIGLQIDVSRDRIRVEVADAAEGAPRLTAPYDTGGYGLSLVDRLASRWGSTRTVAGNFTWFEIDVPQPGAKRERP